jgi:alpha-amylase
MKLRSIFASVARSLAVCLACCTLGLAAAAPVGGGSFADNPIVYFVMTDRFLDGNPANDGSYGRERDGQQEIGTFHGGDLAGLKAKVDEGWFRDLGVNAIWITAPYEQIHGWVVGGNKEFKHYSYHGYYALDYTVLDKNMGTDDELRAFVDAAHAQGIRVLFDVVMNHPGYGSLRDLTEFKVGVVWDGWEKATLNNYHSFIDYNSMKWLDWWGKDWIRAGLRGYDEGGNTEYTKQLAYLPDFKTESPKPVDLPPFFANKPDTRAKPIPGATVRDYLVTWLTQWVRDFGIDGFRCDTVKHVEPDSWRALKKAGVAALADWKAAHPGGAVDTAPFWMTGEYWGHGPGRSPSFDAGFDNMINFDFQDGAEKAALPKLDTGRADKLFAEYAKLLAHPATHNVLSYLSSHDTELFDRKHLYEGAELLMLAPGGVQIYYGDETARPPGPFTPGDKQQATRSDMNWATIDRELLEHWRKLGGFRARHVALARGAHTRISEHPYVFRRVDGEDRVVVALDAAGADSIPVGDTFADGDKVHDAYSGANAVVAGGAVKLMVGPRGVVLLEKAQ